MKKSTQRIIAGLLVFLMIATVLAGVFGAAGNNSLGPAPTSSQPV